MDTLIESSLVLTSGGNGVAVGVGAITSTFKNGRAFMPGLLISLVLFDFVTEGMLVLELTR